MDLPANCHLSLQVDEVRGSIAVQNLESHSGEPPKTFTFDITFGPDCKQLDVYNKVARPVVECVLEGYNGLSCPLLCFPLFLSAA